MQTYTSKIKKKNKLTESSGFSLIEILIVLFLVSIVLSLATSFNFTDRQAIEEELNLLERSIRFGIDDSAIKNVMYRIHFNLDDSPQSYSLEYGPDDNFILPPPLLVKLEQLNLKERAVFEKEVEKINKQFTRVKELNDGKHKLEEEVRIIGIGLPHYPELFTEFHASLYIYPTGEKDNGLIILANDQEVIGISIDPFSREIERFYKTTQLQGGEEVADRQLEDAYEMFNSWRQE